MRKSRVLGALFAAALLTAVATAAGDRPAKATRKAVLVELFTSQG